MNPAPTRGFINIVLILIILFFSILLSGNFFGPKSDSNLKPIVTAGSCCDTGDCHLISPTISFEGHDYGLLKSNVVLVETGHVVLANQKTPTDELIYKNNTGETINASSPEYPDCAQLGQDLFSGSVGCVGSENDTIIYVCKENCPGSGAGPDSPPRYDVYHRTDLPVEDFIKSCTIDNSATGPGDTVAVLDGSPSPEQNLQLRRLKFQPRTTPWLSPYCKPAIYLYPEKETEVNVKVDAVGGLTSSLPKYLLDGWDVKAYPDGQLSYQGLNLDYLYYESRVPDELLDRPNKGFVVKGGELDRKLEEILNQLGLNYKENKQFRDYWVKILPVSSYYFIGLIPESEVEQMSQLQVSPKPDSVLRVTLYFEVLDQPMVVTPPRLENMPRSGFTVVEWGGIFKKDKEHPFSCLM